MLGALWLPSHNISICSVAGLLFPFRQLRERLYWSLLGTKYAWVIMFDPSQSHENIFWFFVYSSKDNIEIYQMRFILLISYNIVAILVSLYVELTSNILPIWDFIVSPPWLQHACCIGSTTFPGTHGKTLSWSIQHIIRLVPDSWDDHHHVNQDYTLIITVMTRTTWPANF